MNWLFEKEFPISSSFRAHLRRRPPSTAPGIDIAARSGTLIRAPANGRVLDVRWSAAGGLSLWIRHGSQVSTYYAHLQCSYVGRGQLVTQGDPLGQVGSTGNATGPHLHFSVKRDGHWVDPAPLLKPIEEETGRV